MSARSGPLADLRVLEFAGIGPVPFCGMLLSDLGADVLRVDRPGAKYDRFMVETRGRRSTVLDLKNARDRNTALQLMEKADALLEGFRPGVMERLGLAPDVALARNPKLVYARMTGWGQTGPLATQPGHDIDYIAIAGVLHAIGTSDRPVMPVNLVGDYGGGALYLAMGVLAALHNVRGGGQGQVVDCAMTEGSASLMAMLYGHLARGSWQDARAANIIDGGAHFYNVYRCADDRWIAVGAIEPQFYRAFIERAGLASGDFDSQQPEDWPRLKSRLGEVFATRTRDDWCAVFEGSEACVVPVLSMREAPRHPQNAARNAFVVLDGVEQPAPAPRFSLTPGAISGRPVQAGEGAREALAEWGVDPDA